MPAISPLRQAVRAILSRPFLRSLRRGLARRRMRKLAHLPLEAAFDRIYEEATWSSGGDELSGGGSYGEVADRYVAFVHDFIDEHSIQSILDIGCGDFNVGSRIAPKVARYYAFDVSARIIELNRRRFDTLAHVQFRHANACTDPLPQCGLVTVRQVLQHLTNQQIEAILRNIERSGCSFALISEHLAAQGSGFKPNLDLPSHSADTRAALDSGVVLSAPPFLRRAQLVHSIPLDGYEGAGDGSGERLGMYLLRL
jgi:SAM-dependent methyltransferase